MPDEHYKTYDRGIPAGFFPASALDPLRSPDGTLNMDLILGKKNTMAKHPGMAPVDPTVDPAAGEDEQLAC